MPPITDTKQRAYFGLPDWLVSYSKDWLRPDIIAGLTAAAVVIPKAMAYATIAGLPVQVGLYTAFLPMIIYAVLGTSRVLSVSTTTTLAILAAAQLSEVVPNGAAETLLRASATLTLLVGAVLVLASILRLGFVANFISEPVLIGFKAGIGLVIVADQIPKLLGIHIPRGSFVHNVLEIFEGLSRTSLPTLAVGLVMIAILVGIDRFFPQAPAPLVAVAVGIAGSAFLGLQTRGVELVGHIPRGLPSFTLPDTSLVRQLWLGAVAIALMSFTETIAAGRAFARADEPATNANRELFATGLANVGGALLGAMPAGGGTTQTAVNRQAGARTQLSELVTAGGTLVTMILLSGVIALMPEATLAAVVIVYSDRFDQAERVPRYPRGSANGIHLGHRRYGGRGLTRNAERNSGRYRCIGDCARAPGCRSACLCPWAKARYKLLPAALKGAPRGRDVPRLVTVAA